MIYQEDGYQFAPAYDLVPSLATGEYHAAAFGYSPSPPKPVEALKLGKIFGLSKACVVQAVEQVVTAMSQWSDFAEGAEVRDVDYNRIEQVFNLE